MPVFKVLSQALFRPDWNHSNKQRDQRRFLKSSIAMFYEFSCLQYPCFLPQKCGIARPDFDLSIVALNKFGMAFYAKLIRLAINKNQRDINSVSVTARSNWIFECFFTFAIGTMLTHLRDFFQPKSLILRFQRIFMKKIPLKSMVFF